jgi:hypothetical protein
VSVPGRLFWWLRPNHSKPTERKLFGLLSAVEDVPPSWGKLWNDEVGAELLQRIDSLNGNLSSKGAADFDTWSLMGELFGLTQPFYGEDRVRGLAFIMEYAAYIHRNHVGVDEYVREWLAGYPLADVLNALVDGVAPSLVSSFLDNDIDPELSSYLLQGGDD